MDIPRKDARKKKIIRVTVTVVILVVAVVGITLGLRTLRPAAPGVEMSTLWPDQVKRGPMVREVRGLGTLVPEDTLLIPALQDGRIERILIKPGNPVRADSVVMVLTNPELESAVHDAEFQVRAAQADFENLRVNLQKARLDLESQVAQVKADYNTSKLQADRDQALLKDGLVSDIDSKISATKAQQLLEQSGLQQKRLDFTPASDQAQLDAQKVKLDQLSSAYELKKRQLDQLKVRAGFEGMLEALPTPVEQGQKVVAGTPLGKVAQPSHLKAELKIAETQLKDLLIGQPAVVDTRNGLIDGRVARIDTSIINGTVTVDVRLEGKLPPGARPDLSVDGTIQLEKLNDVVFVGRPVFGQENSTVQLFKLEADGKYANKVKVAFGRTSVNYIEVKDGLKVGDRVILSDMSAYDNYDRIKLN